MSTSIQDTNSLQEAIYFEIAKSCKTITVVGDDDQSLYRFRGATVELFTEFPKRVRRALRASCSTFFLSENYRSARPIVDLVNKFAGLDAGYQSVRVKGPTRASKVVHAAAAAHGTVFPVLGIFRDNLEGLATALAEFLGDVFRRNGRHIPDAGLLVKDKTDGDLGDCCLLSSSHREFTNANPPRIRLPGLLREELRAGNPSIDVFNPRGQSIASIEEVQIFGGYIAHVINGDKDHLTTSGIGRFDPAATAAIQEWLDAANNHFIQASTPQALKALEFPMVIADIGSDFKRNHAQQRRDRFPHDGETAHKLENLMRPFAKDLGSQKRSERDRAFDDLYRKFFVAFSRPEQCLVLVGLSGSHPQGGHIPNAAAGWDRSGVNRWPKSLPIHYL